MKRNKDIRVIISARKTLSFVIQINWRIFVNFRHFEISWEIKNTTGNEEIHMYTDDLKNIIHSKLSVVYTIIPNSLKFILYFDI